MSSQEDLIAQIEFGQTIGVTAFPTGLEPVTMEVYLDHGQAFYLLGVRSMASEGDDVHLTLLHPRTGKPLFGREEIPAHELSVTDAEFVPPFVPFTETYAEDDIEPLFCSKAEPLRIRVSGSVPMALVLVGDRHYRVNRAIHVSTHVHLGCPPQVQFRRLRGPYKFADAPADPISVGKRDFAAIEVCDGCARKTIVFQIDGSGGEYGPRHLCRACVLAPFEKYESYLADKSMRDDADGEKD